MKNKKAIIAILSCISIITFSGFINYTLHKEINRKSQINSILKKKYSKVIKNTTKNICYSDIINYIEDINKAKIETLSSNDTSVVAKISYNGNIKEFKRFICYLKENSYFVNIENINLTKINDKIKYVLSVKFGVNNCS